jgi:hypothetical protein
MKKIISGSTFNEKSSARRVNASRDFRSDDENLSIIESSQNFESELSF